MDILKTSWLPTDVGSATPEAALRGATESRWHRGDWDLATFCLLHALVQTAIVLEPERCPDRSTWEMLRERPPGDLASWLDLPLGEHPWECTSADGMVPVSRLLPDTPGNNAIKKSSDIARWLQDVPDALTLPQAVIALISDNLWGTRIGTGHYQGARGEQALTTLVEPATRTASLWERVWLNVLPADEWHSAQDTGCAVPFAFPWTQPIPVNPMTPDNTHSAGILWQMPRRWRLIQDADGMVRNVHRQNKGRDYEGWEKRHPLTPYFVKKDGTWTAAKVSAHTGFSDWATIALQGRKSTRPATAVNAFLQMAWAQEPLRLRCCGWALGDAGAAGSWVDHVVPFYVKAEAQADVIEAAVQDADKQSHDLHRALDSAGGGLARFSRHLYSRAEPIFYQHLVDDSWGAERADWRRDLRRVAREVYWTTVESHRIDPLKAARAARRL